MNGLRFWCNWNSRINPFDVPFFPLIGVYFQDGNLDDLIFGDIQTCSLKVKESNGSFEVKLHAENLVVLYKDKYKSAISGISIFISTRRLSWRLSGLSEPSAFALFTVGLTSPNQ